MNLTASLRMIAEELRKAGWREDFNTNCFVRGKDRITKKELESMHINDAMNYMQGIANNTSINQGLSAYSNSTGNYTASAYQQQYLGINTPPPMMVEKPKKKFYLNQEWLDSEIGRVRYKLQ